MLLNRRKDSLGIMGSPAREMEHPSTFPSILRRPHSPSVTPPRRETPSPTQRYNNKRHSMGSFPNLSRANIVNYNRRDSLTSNGIREMKRDYVGSTNSLSRKSSIDTKKSSTDSLDNWHSNWESDRYNFGHTIAPEERSSVGFKKVHFIQYCFKAMPFFQPLLRITWDVSYVIVSVRHRHPLERSEGYQTLLNTKALFEFNSTMPLLRNSVMNKQHELPHHSIRPRVNR